MKQPFGPKIIPSFRPDKAVSGLMQSFFPEYVKRLTKGSISFSEWLDAITARLDFFCSAGCRVSDLSLPEIPATLGSYNQAKEAFDKAMSGRPDKTLESDYISFMVCFLAQKYVERDIVMQLHLSSLRNNSSKLFKLLGSDCGNDSVGSLLDTNGFGKLLNKVESDSGLPKLIVYTLNPSNYYEISTMIGCFQGSTKGMAQLGAAWWFCDHPDGILEQMKVLSVTGLLGKFNGMLTDSRSFTSYVRHDYFRRILCSYVGELVSKGEYDESAAKKVVQSISYKNAKAYFSV